MGITQSFYVYTEFNIYKVIYIYTMALGASWTHGLLAQSVRASEFTKTYLSIAKALTKYSLLSGCYGTLTFM